MTNPNITHAKILVDELGRSGLTHVCFTPGSRNTPMVLAFAKHPNITVHSHLDERSASFFALGLALATDAPVALICTSGTGGANYFPAIIEAHQSRVPLIVLTADRPHELRHSGANQTIDQIKLFGDYALWFVDAPLPEINPPQVALNNLRTLANRAYATANGMRKGVVHINLPFRKPLQPSPDDIASLDYDTPITSPPHTQFQRGKLHPSAEMLTTLREVLDSSPRGIIICGSGCPTGDFPALIRQFADGYQFPIIADVLSGVRANSDLIFTGYESYLTALSPDLDIIIRFGNVPTSKAVNSLLMNNPCQNRVLVSADGVWADDSHLTTHFIHTDPTLLLRELLADTVQREPTELVKQFQRAENITWETLTQAIDDDIYFDGGLVHQLMNSLPDESLLFVGNSLPIRHVDQFTQVSDKQVRIFANRGASGIDGNLSTALGIGASNPDMPLIALMGDVTFYHDMNGLLAVQRCSVPITLIVFNNDGGGIFHRLPINQFDPEFTDYFITPHGLNFTHTAELYGLEIGRAHV